MLGEFQDTEIDLDVIFSTEKFCGGSSGAAIHKHTEMLFFSLMHKLNTTALLASFSTPDSGMRTIVEAICPSPSEVKADTSNK